MKISVVVPAFNEEKHIGKCLQSLKGQIEPAYEIIVVNNNSTDKTVKIAEQFGVTLLHEKIQGMTPARNAGFNRATGDIIARTDADSEVPYDWIEQIKKHFQNEKLMGLSGPSHFEHLPDIVQASNWPNVIMLNATFRSVFHHDVMYGPNMALRKSAWEKIKNEICLEDKDVHEDMDLAIHIGKIGMIRFDPHLVVNSSMRRIKKLQSYFDYPYRYFKTFESHREWLKRLRKATSVKHAVKKTRKKIVKTLSQNIF